MLRSDIKSGRTKRDEFLRHRKVFNREVQEAKRKFWKQKQIGIEKLRSWKQQIKNSFGIKSAKLVYGKGERKNHV